MRISDFNNINFGNVYCVYGKKRDIDNFEVQIKKIANKNVPIEMCDVTSLYAINSSKDSFASKLIRENKQISLCITGKQDCDELNNSQWGIGRATYKIKSLIDASKELPSKILNELSKLTRN